MQVFLRALNSYYFLLSLPLARHGPRARLLCLGLFSDDIQSSTETLNSIQRGVSASAVILFSSFSIPCGAASELGKPFISLFLPKPALAFRYTLGVLLFVSTMVFGHLFGVLVAPSLYG